MQRYPEEWHMSHGYYHDQQRTGTLWEEIALQNFEEKTG